MCCFVCGFVNMRAGAHTGRKMALDPEEFEWQAVVSRPT